VEAEQFTMESVIAGRYTIEHRIGRGGEGVVYAAHDTARHATVAIKVAHDRDKGLAKRFERERSVLERLCHPCVPRLRDAGTMPDGRPFIVVDYIFGIRLDHLQQVRPLSLDEALVCALTVARTLDAIHAIGVLHRDIKPRNILVPVRDGDLVLTQTTLLDYCMTRDVTHAEEGRTSSGTWSGTPLYMAPEQLVGRAQTAATDVFGLGATLHELVFGHAPMAHVVQHTFTYQIFGEPREVILVPERLTEDVVLPSDPAIPRSLTELLESVLRKDMTKRCQSVELVATALLDILRDVGSSWAEPNATDVRIALGPTAQEWLTNRECERAKAWGR
jgi:serine/threonine protein kinase